MITPEQRDWILLQVDKCILGVFRRQRLVEILTANTEPEDEGKREEYKQWLSEWNGDEPAPQEWMTFEEWLETKTKIKKGDNPFKDMTIARMEDAWNHQEQKYKTLQAQIEMLTKCESEVFKTKCIDMPEMFDGLCQGCLNKQVLLDKERETITE